MSSQTAQTFITTMSRAFLEKWRAFADSASTDFELTFPWRVQAAGDKVVVFNTEAQADAWIASVRKQIAVDKTGNVV